MAAIINSTSGPLQDPSITGDLASLQRTEILRELGYPERRQPGELRDPSEILAAAQDEQDSQSSLALQNQQQRERLSSDFPHRVSVGDELGSGEEQVAHVRAFDRWRSGPGSELVRDQDYMTYKIPRTCVLLVGFVNAAHAKILSDLIATEVANAGK